MLDLFRQEPAPSAAVMHGVFFGRIAPPRRERQRLSAPTIILGHRRDPIHAFSDADKLAHELPNSTLIEATSLLELRLTPGRLTGEIHDSLLEVGPPRLRALAAPSRSAPQQRGTVSCGRQ